MLSLRLAERSTTGSESAAVPLEPGEGSNRRGSSGNGGTATNMNTNEVIANLAVGSPLGSYAPVHAGALDRVAAGLARALDELLTVPLGGAGRLLDHARQGQPGDPELVIQVAFDVRAAAHAVELAVAAGELELNVFEPVVARHLVGALGELGRAADLFATRCIDGLEWAAARVTENLRGSLGDLVDLAARDGYERATEASRRLGPLR